MMLWPGRFCTRPDPRRGPTCAAGLLASSGRSLVEFDTAADPGASSTSRRVVVRSMRRGRQSDRTAPRAQGGRRAQLPHQVRRAAQSLAASRGNSSRRPDPGYRRRGFGQDTHAHLPRGAADRKRRSAGRDPLADLHPARGAGDAAAGRAPGRRSHARGGRRHLSFVRQPDAAPASAPRSASSPTSPSSTAPTWRTWSTCCGRGWAWPRAIGAFPRRAPSPRRSAWRATSAASSGDELEVDFPHLAEHRDDLGGWPTLTTPTSASARCSTTTICSIAWPSCLSSTSHPPAPLATPIATS